MLYQIICVILFREEINLQLRQLMTKFGRCNCTSITVLVLPSLIVKKFGHNFFSATIVILERLYFSRQTDPFETERRHGICILFSRNTFSPADIPQNLGVFLVFVDVEAHGTWTFAKLKFLAFKSSFRDKLVARLFFLLV